MKKIIITNTLLVACLMLVAGNVVANSTVDRKPEVELTHWWNHPGELNALETIKDAVESRGGHFVDTKLVSWDKLRSSVINRLNLGYPPAITQWLGSREGLGLNGINAIHSTPATWRDTPLEQLLFSEVFDNMVVDGQLINVPLGIHLQNSALYNAAIYRELELPLPANWQMFLEQAPLIQDAGYIPIALSNEVWQLYMVFNTILLDQVGLDDYYMIYTDQTLEKWREPLEAAFNVLLELRKLADSEHKARSWNRAIEMVGKKEAAMNVMGDFAKGELTAMGLEAGKDYLCSLAPGSRGTMIYAIDGFLMLNVQEDYLKEGQAILLDAVLDPEVQTVYNRKKGSIPVIKKGVDPEQLDDCSRQVYTDWLALDNGQGQGATANGVRNPLRASFFESVIKEAWNTEEVSAGKLVDQLFSMVEMQMKNSLHADTENQESNK